MCEHVGLVRGSFFTSSRTLWRCARVPCIRTHEICAPASLARASMGPTHEPLLLQGATVEGVQACSAGWLQQGSVRVRRRTCAAYAHLQGRLSLEARSLHQNVQLPCCSAASCSSYEAKVLLARHLWGAMRPPGPSLLTHSLPRCVVLTSTTTTTLTPSPCHWV